MNLEKQNAGILKITSNGFTLIELLIVVAIIGLLSAIAIPSYNSYVVRGKITEAHSLLSDYRIRIEQYYQDNRNYGTNCGAVPPPATQYFTFSCPVATAQTYTAMATSTDGAYTYTINELNAKATTQFKGAAVAKSCWLVKGGEC